MPNSNYFFRLATIDDSPAISSLLEEAKRPGLDSQERASQGFVQGDMSLHAIEERFRNGFGAVVGIAGETDSDPAEDIVAVSFFAPVPTDETVDHPLAGLARTIRVSPELDPDRLLSYGPMAVADRAKGQGLARMLFDALDDVARHRGSHELVSLVDNKNIASMSLHRKSGFRAFSQYDFGDSTYTVFVRDVIA